MRGGLGAQKMHPVEHGFGNDIQSKVRQDGVQDSGKQNRANEDYKKEVEVAKQEKRKTISCPFDAPSNRR